jgi:deazaflavin-dependent oxidoreductase (nitroreductase family)
LSTTGAPRPARSERPRSCTTRKEAPSPWPAWFHNLKANPDTTIQIGSDIRKVCARVATDEERDRLWPKFLAVYPGYEFYRRNAKGRKIPIVLLDSR